MSQLSGQSFISSAVAGLTNTYGTVSKYKGSSSLSLEDLSNPSSELLSTLGNNNSFLSYMTSNFSNLDSDGDGSISANDVSKLTQTMQSQGLTYNEISQLAASGAISSSLTETVLNYFNKIDKNGDGRITSAEISAFGFESDRQKMDTKYNSFKGSSISTFYVDSDNEDEPSSVVDSLYPTSES
ncbi:MAG: EF-hand domain-containing protein [Candidatus Gastranaerophilales bacterium]|nr:EF-hand domain-containing protein [Candidatus Gastranaerophilales bacterium]